MTLLETLIALSLLSFLLVIIFGFFRQLSTMSIASEQSQKESFQMRYVESRLTYIFERIVNERDKGRDFFFYTQPPSDAFAESASIIFTFDNGVRSDPLFSGDVVARLYLDRQGSNSSASQSDKSCSRLTLAIWPLYAENPQESVVKEVLLENVKGVLFEFYSPPIRQSNSKDVSGTHLIQTTGAALKSSNESLTSPSVKEIEPESDMWYQNEWLIGFNQMPSIVRMTVTQLDLSCPLEKKTPSLSQAEKKLTFNFVLPSSKNPIYYPPDSTE